MIHPASSFVQSGLNRHQSSAAFYSNSTSTPSVPSQISKTPVLKRNPVQSVVQSPRVLGSGTNIIGLTNSLKGSIKGETIFERVPFERSFIEHVEVKHLDYIPVERKVRDFYAIEHQTEYIPQTRYDKYIDYKQVVRTEYEAQKRTEYVPTQKVEYVPRVVTNIIPNQRVEEKVDYIPVSRSIVHGPSPLVEQPSNRGNNNISMLYHVNKGAIYMEKKMKKFV